MGRPFRLVVAAVSCTSAAAAIVAASGAIARADVVRLRSGDVVEGAFEDLGDRIRVKSPDRVVSLRWRDVESVVPGATTAEEFRTRRAAVEDSDAAGLYALGLWARRAGLPDAGRKAFEAALAADPQHAAARDALSQQNSDGKWLAGESLLEAKGFVAREGAWVLREEAESLDRRAAAAKGLTDDEKKVEQVIAQAAKAPPSARKFALEALKQTDDATIRRPALRALRRGTPDERAVAARLLGRVEDVDVLRPLVHSAVMDREPSVRAAAAESLHEIGDPDVVKPLAKAMWSASPEVRMNAGEALGTVGGVQSVQWILSRVMTSGGPGGRNNLFVGSQVTYVADFDVEIAQAAQIGDPIVQTIREGVMLDARVLGVQEEFTIAERRVYHQALARATGKDFGEDTAAWKKWFDAEGRAEMTARAEAATR